MSLIYPFLPPRAIDQAVEAGLTAAIAGIDAFAFRLAAVDRFPGVVYLAPEPSDQFVAIVEALVQRWPRWQPYGGKYDDFIPHLTVAEGITQVSGLDELAAMLPVDAAATEVQIITKDRNQAEWSVRFRSPLNTGARLSERSRHCHH